MYISAVVAVVSFNCCCCCYRGHCVRVHVHVIMTCILGFLSLVGTFLSFTCSYISLSVEEGKHTVLNY